MLHFENEFIFCLDENTTTTVHNKNSRRHKRELQNQMLNAPEVYLWTLCEFLGYPEDDLMLMEVHPKLPSKDIGQGLTDEWVLLNLNSKKCFNFDYSPKQGDYLSIKSSKKYDYMSFIFQNEVWERGFYHPPVFLQLIAKGEVRKNEESIY